MGKKEKGFTLIELLVVIGIIGLLASIVLVGLSKAREGARDTKRVADIMQIVTAIELYYNNNGYYPFNPPEQPPTDSCVKTPNFKNCSAASFTRADVRCPDGRPSKEDWLSCLLGSDIAPVSPHDPLENQGVWRYAYYLDQTQTGMKYYNIGYVPENQSKCPDNFQKKLIGKSEIYECVYSGRKLP